MSLWEQVLRVHPPGECWGALLSLPCRLCGSCGLTLLADCSQWTLLLGKATHAHGLIQSFACSLFCFIVALLRQTPFSIKFFFSDVWESVLLFTPLFVCLFAVSTGPFQTIVLKGHSFPSTGSGAQQRVNDTQTSHIKIISCMIINSSWVQIEELKCLKKKPLKILVKMLKYISQLHKILLYCLASFQTWHGLFCLWTQVEQKATECNLCQELDYRRTTNSN